MISEQLQHNKIQKCNKNHLNISPPWTSKVLQETNTKTSHNTHVNLLIFHITPFFPAKKSNWIPWGSRQSPVTWSCSICVLPSLKSQTQGKSFTCHIAAEDNEVYCQQRTRKYEIFDLGFSKFKSVVQRHARTNSKLWGIKLNSYRT